VFYFNTGPSLARKHEAAINDAQVIWPSLNKQFTPVHANNVCRPVSGHRPLFLHWNQH